MKALKTVMAFALVVSFMSCIAQPKKPATKVANNGKVEAYYFHFSSRCVTCKSVEAQAKEDLEKLYPEQVKQGKITFQSINLDDASSAAIAEKLKVSGQSLLLVKDGKQVNITNEGFIYARSSPDKFKEIIKEKVDGMLK